MAEYYPIIKDACSFLRELATDYQEAIPEAKALYDECQFLLANIDKIAINNHNKETLQKIKEEIEEGNKEAQELLDNTNKERKLLGKMAFNMKLLVKAKGYRESFDARTKRIEKYINSFMQVESIIKPEPPSKLPALAQLFWIKSFKENTRHVSWDEFVEKYSDELNTNKEEIIKIKPYISVKEQVTTYSFYAACTQFGYPIMCPIQPVIDSIKLANLIMNLNKEFYSPEFGEHWYALRALDTKPRDHGELYRKLEGVSLNNKEEWKRINISRGLVSSLFQRYMMLWRIGKASQEMFDNIDFPGKGRINFFIHVCGTIDEVNYKENLKIERPWSSGKPQVYDFLQTLIED
ncbi:hypothetical protein COEREDRAFT_90170 [Coemansia reversa NRRL 1564]|uniref:Uncharacterized protein n=1 Tax=Coemansia reversa (strain ATCC 12441 / NRRL 1564) TaxID=763665 RepID=A0A2G5B0N2_COERN|nr:hypothetical protein COEREDRAFT_90170 [Coemansia reversa NRRL 1564]|eukprot:PIA12570.1 hypothetical protein COEREDRAFT_90170 [Coemansia reversa NRRL 1564]